MVKVKILQPQTARVLVRNTEIIVRGECEPYRGAYNVTPAIEPITLETKDKIMNDNVTVFAIPYWETSNETGTTAIIGGINDGL